jgi:hypothetical protein
MYDGYKYWRNNSDLIKKNFIKNICRSFKKKLLPLLLKFAAQINNHAAKKIIILSPHERQLNTM